MLQDLPPGVGSYVGIGSIVTAIGVLATAVFRLTKALLQPASVLVGLFAKMEVHAAHSARAIELVDDRMERIENYTEGSCKAMESVDERMSRIEISLSKRFTDKSILHQEAER